MHESPAALAAVCYPRGFAIDYFLLAICDELSLRNVSLGGLLQSSARSGDACADSVLVTDLRSGESFDIWDRRGRGARGCRLDENGLFQAEPAIRAAIEARVDLLLINRFGRAESLGRGLVSCFTAALEAEIPILTAVRPPYDEAWRSFHAGHGCELTPEPDAVLSWILARARGSQAA